MAKLEYIKFILDQSSASEVVKKQLNDWIEEKYGVKNKFLFSYEEFKDLIDWFIINQRQFYVIPYTNKSRRVTFS